MAAGKSSQNASKTLTLAVDVVVVVALYLRREIFVPLCTQNPS
jgi:hypothetical protein